MVIETYTIIPYKTGIRLLAVARNPANGFPARPLATELRERHGYQTLSEKSVNRCCGTYAIRGTSRVITREFKTEVSVKVREVSQREWPKRLRDLCSRGDHSFLWEPGLKDFVTVVVKDDGVNQNGTSMTLELRTCFICQKDIKRRGLSLHFD